MKHASRFALALLVSTSLTVSAYAANINDDVVPDTAPVEMAAKAKPDLPKSGVAKPLSAWLVGPSQASQFDAKDDPDGKGCLMVTEFDNGMIIGLHARAAGIVGMTLDTRKNDLVPGSMKTMGLNLGPDAYVVKALASDASTLSIDLKEAGGGKKVAERLTSLGNFRLLLDEKPVYFATTGFTDGLARLQACMGGMMAVSVPVVGPGVINARISEIPTIETKKVTSSGNATPIALAMPELIPVGYKFVLDDVDPMMPINWQAGDEWTEVMRKALSPHNLKMSLKDQTVYITKRASLSEPVLDLGQKAEQEVAEVRAIPPIMDDNKAEARIAADEMMGVWGGARGENLGSVLEAWGLMAGVKVKVDLVGDLRLPEDVRYEGRFDEAVQKLLGQFSGKNRPVGEFEGSSISSALSSPPPVAIRQDTPQKRNIAPSAPVSTAPEKEPWKPMSAQELAAMAKEAQSRWVELKQMAPVPDPANAPKVVKKSDEFQTKVVTGETPKTVVKNSKTMGTWQALQGTSLRDALEHWAKDAGVQVVWQADQSFPLPETVKTKGSFDEAVSKLLAQYAAYGARPSAQLNEDPNTGEKALIIKTISR